MTNKREDTKQQSPVGKVSKRLGYFNKTFCGRFAWANPRLPQPTK
ncbi:MAG: hypothetical protein U9N54_02840 [candidate division Zixibacteria bacterium]|nr:hypothetical protein [candidate division Zixibacteria bacterium]